MEASTLGVKRSILSSEMAIIIDKSVFSWRNFKDSMLTKMRSKLICKLNKAPYGLEQTLCAWFDKLKACLLRLGFQSSRIGQSLWCS